MTDLITPLPEAMVAKLAADSNVRSLLGNPARVYDHRPAMATFPYVVLAQGEARNIGTKTLAVSSQLVTLQVFSRQRGGAEVRKVLASLRTALHDATLTLSAGSVARVQEEFVSVRFDAQSEASSGLARYRVVVTD